MNQNEILTGLYQHCKDSGRCPDGREALETLDFLYADLEEKGLRKDDFENLAISAVSAYEKQGFISGFKYAVQILMCCGSGDLDLPLSADRKEI